jgi:hypothetical protein
MAFRLAISFLLVNIFVFSQEKTFEERYASDYQKAVVKCISFNKLADSVTKVFKLPKAEVMSIVFPELVRYSLFSDVIETNLLVLFYVEQGNNFANFSIGNFQMKPSFIEALEKEIEKDASLKKKYGALLLINGKQEKEIRKVRIYRMQNLKMQLTYLCCFYDYLNIKFKAVIFATPEERVKIYATAYNAGLYLSYEKLLQKKDLKFFPEGNICIRCNNYCYSDISVEFYKKKYLD